MSPRLHLLPWNRPLLPQAATWLAGKWSGGGPLDLSDQLVVVPTRQSGRRLREALAELAAAHDQAVFPPKVVLPETLLSLEAAPTDVASRVETLLSWVAVLRRADLGEFPAVFPASPASRDFAWALRLAGTMVRVQAGLLEGGLRIRDVSARLGADFPEADRWRQLGELERLQREELAANGRRAINDTALDSLTKTSPPAGSGRIVLLGVPDPLPLARRLLANWAESVAIDVVAFGPADGAGLFDAWGQPRTDRWSQRSLELGDFEKRVRLCADPAAQAELIAGCARGYRAPAEVMAIGVADSDVLPFLENEFSRGGLTTYNPEGRPIRRDRLFALLENLAALVGDASFENAAALTRCPDVLVWLQNSRPDFSIARFLAGLDELHARHLPTTLADALEYGPGMAREFGELPGALTAVAGLRDTLAEGVFPTNAAKALATIFGGRDVNPADPAGANLEAAAGAWQQVAQHAQQAGQLGAGLTIGDWWELALQQLAEGKLFDEKPADAVDLQGWLELLWEDAPHLVVAGLNDGRVPEAIVGDAFLPESLRERLGLKTNEARFARDAYLLSAIAACRSEVGQLDLVYGKVSAAGDPLRPSRLLLRCAEEELPGRVAYLFRAAETARAGRPWQRAWTLQPRIVAPPEYISVTAFKHYLRCPFRFYLTHVLKMEAVDAEKSELDAFDFGNLCHVALEAMGREPALRDCTEAKTVREFLLGWLDRAARARYGKNVPLPLVVQFESARQRLARAAEIQVRERAAGWITERVEWKFPADRPVRFGDLVVRGKIDRIDRNEYTGAVRVLDYKTSDKPVNPRDAHCRRARKNAPAALPETQFPQEGKELEWIDLQLPLYREALAREFGAEIACGYFNLPKAVGETGVAMWDEFNSEWQAAAMRCGATVAHAIQAGRFWPPNEEVDARQDQFAALFHRGTADSVAPAWAKEVAR